MTPRRTRLIATEEAFTNPEVAAAVREVVQSAGAPVERPPERGRAPSPHAVRGPCELRSQDPPAAAKEIERAIGSLELNGFLVNSHTQDGYLDEPRFWPILEAAEALGAPLCIHPRAPSDGMAAPFRDYRMEGSIRGYGMEASTHAVRLMLSGVLDRFPRLRIILGHMGEALPFRL